MNNEINVIEIIDSYCALRSLEDNSDYFGNVDMLMTQYPQEIIQVCEYIYNNYIPKDKKNV